jgi:hypothetical protein
LQGLGTAHPRFSLVIHTHRKSATIIFKATVKGSFLHRRPFYSIEQRKQYIQDDVQEIGSLCRWVLILVLSVLNSLGAVWCLANFELGRFTTAAVALFTEQTVLLDGNRWMNQRDKLVERTAHSSPRSSFET